VRLCNNPWRQQGAGKTTAAAKLALYCMSRAEKEKAFEKVGGA
jgi:hypothetical protein